MSFRPSALSGRYYGDAEAIGTSGSSSVASTGSDIAAGVQIAGSLFETGASVYQTAQAAKAAKDEARRRAKRRKKQASASTTSSMQPSAVAPPEAKTDWVKWGLVGLAGVAAIAVFFAVRQKPEAEPARLPVVPRTNPRPKARVIKRVTTEEVDEADEADGPDEAEE